MRIRTLATAFVISAVATLPLAGVAAASDGDTCPPPAPAAPDTSEGTTLDYPTDDSDESDDTDDYSTDEESADDESTDEAAPEEPVAAVEAEVTCTQVAVVPVGGVETGDGAATTDPAPALLALAGVSVLGLGAAARRAARQSR